MTAHVAPTFPTGRLPKLAFPTGHWHSLAESYFDMYGVAEYLWIRDAKHHLDGAAGRWFQSIEPFLHPSD